jgi:hypothetical protein
MQTFSKIEKRFMPVDFFEKIIKDNASFIKTRYGSVAPYFRGEPLIHPGFWDMCDILENYEISNSGIHSNFSMKIDFDRWVKNRHMCVVANIGGVTKEIHEKVMLNSNFDLVADNIKTAFALRLPLGVKMNSTKLNYAHNEILPDFVRSLGGAGESDIVSYTTTCPVPMRCTKEELKYFFDNVFSDGIDDKLRFKLDDDGAIIVKTNDCNHRSDAVYADGKMTICCQDQYGDLVVGDLKQNMLHEIVESELYKNTVDSGMKKCLSMCEYCA